MSGREHRITRRSFLGKSALGLGGLVVAVPLLEACASSPEPSAPAQPAAPTVAAPAPAPTTAPQAAASAAIKRGGEVRFGGPFTYLGLDPTVKGQPNEGFRLLYDNFFRYVHDPKTDTFELQPELVEQWEWKDRQTVVWELRRGVKFHDGSDFNADVAKWNLERMISHPQSLLKGNLAVIDSVTKMDDYTVQVSLKQPSVPVLITLSSAELRSGVVSMAAVDKMGEEEFNRNPIGSGPMQFAEWIPDDKLAVKRFPGFWENGEDGQPLPYADSVVARYIPDASVALVEIRSGNIDMLRDIQPQDVANVKGSPELLYDEIPFGGQLYFKFGFNATDGPFSDNIKLRQAAQHAIDREAMAKAVGFGIAKAHSFPYWGPGMLGYDPSLPHYTYDPARARDLMAEAGYADGLDISIALTARQPESRLAEIVQAMWGEVGIRATIEATDRAAWTDRIKARNFDVIVWRGIVWADPDIMNRQIKTGATDNWTGWSNAEMDQLMAEGAAVADPQQRAEIYKNAQQVLYDDAIIGVGYLMPGNNVFRQGLKGVEVHWSIRDLRRAWWDR